MKNIILALGLFLSSATVLAEPAMERTQAFGQSYFGFGPASLSNVNSYGSVIAASFAKSWNADQQFDIVLSADGALSTGYASANMLVGHLGGNYILPVADFAPFVGASLGYGVAHATSDAAAPSDADYTAGGFSFSLRGGVKLFPKSTVNLGVMVEYMRILDSIYFGQPSLLSLKVGVYF